MNSTVVQALAKLANQDDNVQEWDRYLEPALLVIRTMPNDSTGHSAAKVLYSYDLRRPVIWSSPPHSPCKTLLSRSLPKTG